MPTDPEHPDALADGPPRGRGAAVNPGNRFVRGERGVIRLHVLGSQLDRATATAPEGLQVPTEMLGFSCGLDFETRIMVKPDAPNLLRRELAAPRWEAEPIAMSGVTDPYQPLERRLRVTRGCLEVMAECAQPVAIVTKSRLVLRDVDLLRTLAAHGAVSVAVSLTTLDPALARTMEPRAASPRDRLEAIRALSDASIPVMVMVAPVIPGLTDHELPALLTAAAEAGATTAAWVLLRLPHQVRALFLDWLARHHPERADRVERAVRETRKGALYESTFGIRGRGRGPRAEHVARLFEVYTRRLGLDRRPPALSSAAFRKPGSQDQKLLF